MSVCGEIENSTAAIQRLTSKLSKPDTDPEKRRKLECELAYEQKRLQQLKEINLNRRYA